MLDFEGGGVCPVGVEIGRQDLGEKVGYDLRTWVKVGETKMVEAGLWVEDCGEGFGVGRNVLGGFGGESCIEEEVECRISCDG